MSNTLIPGSSSDVKLTSIAPWLMQRGLASVLGTGMLVGVGMIVNVAGATAIAAIPMAAIAVLCTELNAAQLATLQIEHYQGGEYRGSSERGFNPWLGFTADWALLLAKLATAAIAASGFAGYLLNLFGQSNLFWLMPIALLLIASLTALFLARLPAAKASQPILLAIVLMLLFFFLESSLKSLSNNQFGLRFPVASFSFSSATFSPKALSSFLQASALMFFAYTESRRLPPHPSVPIRYPLKAGTTLLTMLLYLSITIVGIGTVGSQAFGEAADSLAPLAIALRQMGQVSSAQLVAAGAAVILCGIVANLMLEAARSLQAMAQQQDAPDRLARFNAMGSPSVAVAAVGGAIVCLILMLEVETLWAFGAFAALLYAVLTHLTVLNLSATRRLFTGISLGICLLLAFWINPKVWLVSLALAVVGLIWRGINEWVKQQTLR